MKTEFDGKKLVMGDTQHETRSLGTEPTEPGFPYSVEPYQIEGELGEVLDAAKIDIQPNGFTPPQQLIRQRDGWLQQDYLLDFPVKGNGTLLLYKDGKIELHDFDDEDESQQGLGIVYSAGTYLCWKAGSKGLTFIEACSPPFQVGDARTVDIHDASTPAEFREAFLKLTQKIA